MESLYPPRGEHETSDIPIPSPEDLDQTRSKTIGSTFDPKSFQLLSGTSGFRDISSSEYAMAHHNQDLWPKIYAILTSLAEPIPETTSEVLNAKSEAFIEAISYFTSDEECQTQLRGKQKDSKELKLKDFFENLTPTERTLYQGKVIPGIARLILETEKLFPGGNTFPLLKQGSKQRVELSRKQCACLLAHMTMCSTYHQRNAKLAEMIDFSVLETKMEKRKSMAKIECIFTYFEKFFDGSSEGKVIFERSVLEGHHSETEWEQCEEILTKAEIKAQGSTEDTRDALQVIFSDKNLGGQNQNLEMAIGQQQIMSFMHPELILSILFCEEMQQEEAIRIYGARRISKCESERGTKCFSYEERGDFRFFGAYKEESVIEREHVIMDAEKYHYKQAASQFHEKYVLREVNKAYAGFQTENENRRKVATGNWGGGAFKGNRQLKFMIQWLAASRAGRGIVFYLFDDTKNFDAESVKRILHYYEGKEVGELFTDLRKAMLEMQFIDDNDAVNKNLFGVLINQLGS